MGRQIKIEFLGDTSDLDKATRSASGDLDHFSKRAGAIGGAVAAGTQLAVNAVASAAGALGGFIQGSLAEAEESVKLGKVQAQLLKTTGNAAKTSAKHLDTYATTLSNLTGIDDEVFTAGQNILLTFKQVRNETGKGNDVFDRATAAAADLSAVMGTDLNSNVLMLGKALADPTKGVTKLTRAGVNFTKTEVDQIKALQKAGDTLGAQKVILGEVEAQVGGAAAANATATQRMQTAWANFKEAIGKLILPVFEQLVDVMISRVLPALQEAADKVAEIAGKIANSAGFQKLMTFLQQLGQWAADHAAEIATAAAALATFAVSLKALGAADKAIKSLQEMAKAGSLIEQLLPILTTNPWFLLIAAIIALGVALFIAYKKFKPIHDVIDAIGRVTMDALKTAFDWIIATWPKVLDALRGPFDAFLGVIAAIVDVAVAFWARFGDEIIGIVVALGELFAAVFARIAQIVGFAFDVISAIFSAVFPVIVAVAQTALSIFETITRTVLSVIQGLWSLFGSYILNAITIVFGVILNVIEGALRIIQGVIQVVTAVISGDWGKAWDGIKNILSGVWQIISGILQGALKWVQNEWAAIGHLLSQPFENVVETIKGMLSGVAGIFTSIFDTAVAEIKRGVNLIIDLLNDAIRAYNSIPIAPDIPTIPRVQGASSGSSAGPRSFQRGALMTAPAAAPATFGSRTFVINLPEGVNGHSVVNQVRRYERRNGSTTLAGWKR